jgi:hypothetical protein
MSGIISQLPATPYQLSEVSAPAYGQPWLKHLPHLSQHLPHLSQHLPHLSMKKHRSVGKPKNGGKIIGNTGLGNLRLMGNLLGNLPRGNLPRGNPPRKPRCAICWLSDVVNPSGISVVSFLKNDVSSFVFTDIYYGMKVHMVLIILSSALFSGIKNRS